MLRLTVWMNVPSFHQGDLFRALIASGEVDLQVIFAKRLPSDRIQAGWRDDLEGYPHRFVNKRLWAAMSMAWEQRDRIHVVNGLWAEPSFAAALVVLAAAGSAYAIYSEVPDHFKSPHPDPYLAKRSFFKELLKTPFGRLLAPKAAGVLPVSHFAELFFKRLGVSDEAIYPFGYFRSGYQHAATPSISSDARIDVVFVGRLIRLKGIDLLIEAMLPLFEKHNNLSLTVVGGGELMKPLREQVEALGISERVSFEGVLPTNKVQERLAKADLLVTPSRGDGWGLAVNEAFSVGVPVIVSDRCGAADLVRDGVNGYVFRSEDVEDLRRCIGR
ncbi:MAG TPA: glycosyltransferase family 4 protein, partial [Blastocatellia bacterium]|nr:glycosyltransferase family 4 protein [Blastocatellia bacterium]